MISMRRSMAGAAAAVIVLAGLAAGAPPRVRSVRLYVFDCGVLKRGEPTAYGLTRAKWGRPILPIPVTSSSIRGARCSGTWASSRTTRSKRGESRSRPQTASTRPRRPCAASWRRSGIRRADITYLALSHGHADHVANANEYAGATLLLQKAEWDAMFSADAQKLPLFAAYSALESSRTVQLERRSRRVRRRIRHPEVHARPHAGTPIPVRETGEDGSRSVDRRSLSLRCGEDDEGGAGPGLQQGTDGGVAVGD